MKKKKWTVPKPLLTTNAVESTAPTSVWGYKGCAGKGGKTLNAKITEKETQKESD